jgi:hypothetical protein
MIVDVLVRLIDVLAAVDELEVEERSFDGHDALEPEARDGHGFDGMALGDALRLELVEVGVEERVEILRRFVGKDDGVCAKSVADRVARGSRFSFGGDGASGFGAVGSGGFGF